MSDGKLRDLERAFRASGSVEDEAAWLAHRVRIGDLDGWRLQVAGFLGSPVPQDPSHELAASGAKVARWAEVSPSTVARWKRAGAPSVKKGRRVLYPIRGLIDWMRPRDAGASSMALFGNYLHTLKPEASWRAAVAALRLGPPMDKGRVPTLEAWIASERQDPDSLRSCNISPQGDGFLFFGLQGARHLVRSMQTGDEDAAGCALDRTCLGLRLVSPNRDTPREEIERDVEAAIRADLVPWLLGERDPIRERVEARQREAEG